MKMSTQETQIAITMSEKAKWLKKPSQFQYPFLERGFKDTKIIYFLLSYIRLKIINHKLLIFHYKLETNYFILTISIQS